MKKIMIDWKGPFVFNEEQKLQNKNDKVSTKDNKPLFNNIGLYQVYGHHPVYGSKVLLYIGITTEQTFQKRLINRNWMIDNYDIDNIEVYLGKLLTSEKKLTKQEEKKLIANAESLLIYTHSPAKNSSNINSVKYDELLNTIVWNYGSIRDLMPEVSGAYWLDELANYKLIDKLIKNNQTYLKLDKDKHGTYGFFIENEDIWIGVEPVIWDEYGIPLVIAFNKDNWKTDIENSIEEEGWLYFELKLDDINSINLEEIKNQINNIKSTIVSYKRT